MLCLSAAADGGPGPMGRSAPHPGRVVAALLEAGPLGVLDTPTLPARRRRAGRHVPGRGRGGQPPPVAGDSSGSSVGSGVALVNSGSSAAPISGASSTRPWSTSPTAADKAIPGPRTSMPAPEPEGSTTRTPSGSSPAPGCGSSGAAGPTTPPTPQQATSPRSPPATHKPARPNWHTSGVLTSPGVAFRPRPAPAARRRCPGWPRAPEGLGLDTDERTAAHFPRRETTHPSLTWGSACTGGRGA